MCKLGTERQDGLLFLLVSLVLSSLLLFDALDFYSNTYQYLVLFCKFLHLQMCIGTIWCISTTLPFIDTMLYVLYISVIESATLRSRFAFLTLAEPSKVFIKINPSSISAQTGVARGEPSFDKVDI